VNLHWLKGRSPLKLSTVVAGLLLSGSAVAQVMEAEKAPTDLHLRLVESSRLVQVQNQIPHAEAAGRVAEAANAAWFAFEAEAGGEWVSYVDARTGRVAYLEGSGIAWLPGRGNRLTREDVERAGLPAVADMVSLERHARAFVPRIEGLMGLGGFELKLNAGRSGSPAPQAWFVDFDVAVGGRVVEGARVVFSVNNGNLVSVGTENLPVEGAQAPAVRVKRTDALAAVERHVGGFTPADTILDRGSYHLLPALVRDDAQAEGFATGNGRDLVGVWEVKLRRAGVTGTFRARVDGRSGEILEFLDVNEYGSATGGTYQGDRPAPERVLPLPFTNVASGVFTNSAGIFSGTTGTTTLNGQYVAISDSCGAISKAADASGVIAMGSGTGTDCTTPGSGGAGNTHAARTQFYALNRIKEVGRGWLPSNTWLAGKLTANVNIVDTCNAYWNGSTVNFFRSGGGCANTGELPGVSLHEWGHGMDTNDGGGTSPDNGTGETYGDFTAALATHTSCTGNGFLGSNCGGYGNACTACTGVRDIDWAKHSRNTASTVQNFTRNTCPQPNANNPNYVGPCGKDAMADGATTKKREGHCESLVSSEALWDLAARDLPSPGSGSAWATVDRLWYLSRSTASAAFTCETSGGTATTGTWTSSGCNTGSLFRVFRTIDDDNGNLADGTPHGGAIYAAFNRHLIACTTDAGANVTFAGCTPPAAPSLALTAGSNSVGLSWSGSTGVYDVYRNETGCNAGFTKFANDLSATSTTDNAVANGLTYYYQVVAQPSGNEACASAPSTCQSVTPAPVACTPPAAPTGLSATAASQTQVNLSWTASSGATSYTVSRATVSGGPYTSIGTSATTSFSDTTASCNTAYFYVVSASNGTCSSGNSSQATATTNACTGNVLTKAVPVTGIGGATGSQQFWTMSVPAGSTNLTFNTSGGTGDADLYVRFGSAPTTTTFDCKSESATTTESCTIAAPSAGTWHVLIYGYSTFSGMSLTGNYTPGGGGGGELLTNGGFETGTTPWVTSGTVTRSTGTYPQAGTAYMILGGANSASGSFYQQVAVPTTATGTLNFYLNVTSDETTTTTVYDRLFVEVTNSSGTVLATPATYSNLNKGTAGVYSLKTLDLSAYKGQTIRVQFRGTTDSSLITSFRVDTVSLQ
jgi:hypothetical protein